MFIGVDYSITSPCVCVIDVNARTHIYCLSEHVQSDVESRDEDISLFIEANTFKKDGRGTDLERFSFAAGKIVSFIQDVGGWDFAAIEDYSMGSKGKVFNIAEATGIFKMKALETLGLHFTPLAPAHIKKFFHGKGNADKKMMWEACKRDHPDFAAFLSTGLFHTKSSRKKMIDELLLPGESPLADVVDAFVIACYAKKILGGC